MMLCLLVAFACAASVAQAIAPPLSGATITSPYGNRHHNDWWHSGVDYGGVAEGTGIEAVEGGEIEALGWSGAGGWRIRIAGTGCTWTYMHLFSGETEASYPANSKGYTLDCKKGDVLK